MLPGQPDGLGCPGFFLTTWKGETMTENKPNDANNKHRKLWRVQVQTPSGNWDDWYVPTCDGIVVYESLESATEAVQEIARGYECKPNYGTRQEVQCRIIDATLDLGTPTRKTRKVGRG